MKTAFDIGMYDGADTSYYLQCGYSVIAVEANPAMIARAEQQFASAIARGQLQLLNVAIAPEGRTVELTICGDDLGSSSILEARVSQRHPIGKFTVRAMT